MLDQRPLVLKRIALREVVKLVIEVLVDLAAGTVLDEEATEDPLAAHPQNLPIVRCQHTPPRQVLVSSSSSTPKIADPPAIVRVCVCVCGCVWAGSGRHVLRHAGIGGTLALSEAAVAADPAGEVQLAGARARVHCDGLLDDEAIGNQLADGLPRVGVGDLADLAGVQPDLALAAAQDGRRQALLGPQVNPTSGRKVSNPRRGWLREAPWHRIAPSPLSDRRCIRFQRPRRKFDQKTIQKNPSAVAQSTGKHWGYSHLGWLLL